MILGITGNIGSGKTTAAKMFEKRGYIRIDADKIAHRLIKNDSETYRRIVNGFGNGILDRNKNIDREKLGEIVFGDGLKLKKLNSITHPAIINEIKNKINEMSDKDEKIIIDAPLLIETDAKKLADKILVVKADTGKIIERNKRFSEEQIERILKRQMPLGKKLKHADFVIDNGKDLKYLEGQVAEIIEVLNK